MHQTPIGERRDQEAILSAALVGIGLAAAGVCFALLAVSTPFASRIASSPGSGPPGAVIPAIAFSLAIVAGAGLIIGGTDRVAASLASYRWLARRRSLAARATKDLPFDLDIAVDVVPAGGRPIPEVVSGPFGVAVIHELGRAENLRRIGTTWEARTRDGWVPTEHPVDRAARDAERMRHWLSGGDLDFVVRVYAAVVTTNPVLARSPLCAVLSEDQLADWFASLPRQRSLNTGRRDRLASRIDAATQVRAGR
jgi:hypothetical protein